MRRNNIRKTEALIMAFALSASLLLTSCGNQNTNGDSVNENNKMCIRDRYSSRR